MTYLVDVNVLSEGMRANPNPKVIDWLATHESVLAIDPIILGEIQVGILAMPQGKRRFQLEEWFSSTAKSIECIPWDRAVSLRWVSIYYEQMRKGTTLPLFDSMIAATALTHNLVVATRDEADFRRTGVKVFNPFT